MANNEPGIKNKSIFLQEERLKILNDLNVILNVLIDGINFYNQPINDSIKQYDEVKKVSTGRGDDYTTGCLLDYEYF